MYPKTNLFITKRTNLFITKYPIEHNTNNYSSNFAFSILESFISWILLHF